MNPKNQILYLHLLYIIYIMQFIKTNFLLNKTLVFNYKFKDIYGMKRTSFNKNWDDRFIPWIFPNEDQREPKLTDNDKIRIYIFSVIIIEIFLQRYVIIRNTNQVLKMLLFKFGIQFNHKLQTTEFLSEYILIKYNNTNSIIHFIENGSTIRNLCTIC